MNINVFIVILAVILFILVIGFFMASNYGYNIGFYDMLLFFIIISVLLFASVEIEQSGNNYNFQTPTAKDKNNFNAQTPVFDHHSDGKPPDISKIDFSDFGVGGLDEQIRTIFRTALFTRFLPKEKIRQAKIKHTKGVILYGPPGTGKTTMVRMMAKILKAKDVKVINGPEIFNKFVGASEENLRAVFKTAKDDYQANGENAGLHIIIFDEIDAIGSSRGGHMGGSGVNDTVLNQFLTEMDGVEQYDNIIVFGTTNRLDMLDPALLRSGRFDVKIEIGLPDVDAREKILHVHTKHFTDSKMFSPDIDLHDLAKATYNYTGADIESLINKAFSYATERYMFDNISKEDILIIRDDIDKSLADMEIQTYV